jgi:hypothetical protein
MYNLYYIKIFYIKFYKFGLMLMESMDYMWTTGAKRNFYGKY